MPFLRPKNPKLKTRVAYFSMEFAFSEKIPNYAGGLGVLAADFAYSMADKNYPAVGLSLIYHQDDRLTKGFDPRAYMTRLEEEVHVTIEGREVKVGVYEYTATSPDGNTIPIYCLTTHCKDNEIWDRDITKHLYASDQYGRLCQEIVLGIGGVRMLRALGYQNIRRFHLNEGHAAFSTLELQREYNWDDDKVRKHTRFTTHTPIPAGHDRFPYDLAYQVLGDELPWHIKDLATHEELHTTHLAMNLSLKTNGVAQKHGEVCRHMFPDHKFEAITNGVHHVRWASEATRKVYDQYLPGWREKPQLLQKAPEKVPTQAVIDLRKTNKQKLISWVNKHPEFFPDGKILKANKFDNDTLTVVFARRFVPYKRPLLIFHDLERLLEIGNGKLQLIFAGHCHPSDGFCNAQKDEILNIAKKLKGKIRIALVPDYRVDIAEKLVAGANLWLNTPTPPREASGTSGMKAALNGVQNLSVLDGWWIEGKERRPDSGWGFGEVDLNNPRPQNQQDDIDATALYDALEEAVDIYYNNPNQWIYRCKQSMGLVGYFNAHRCIDDYHRVMWK